MSPRSFRGGRFARTRRNLPFDQFAAQPPSDFYSRPVKWSAPSACILPCQSHRAPQFVLREFERHSLGNATKIYPPLTVITGRSFPPFVKVWRGAHGMPSLSSPWRSSCAGVKRHGRKSAIQWPKITTLYVHIGARLVPVINAHEAIVFGESPGDLFSRADNRARPAAGCRCVYLLCTISPRLRERRIRDVWRIFYGLTLCRHVGAMREPR